MTKGSEERNLMEFFFWGVRRARERLHVVYLGSTPHCSQGMYRLHARIYGAVVDCWAGFSKA